MLALCDLLALAPPLAACPSLLYFHENQLAYPSRTAAPRDNHFGFTQLTSARAATRIAFNSRYNRDSFLERAKALLTALPDAVPPGWVSEIEHKSVVLPVPLDLDPAPVDAGLGSGSAGPESSTRGAGPVILWNHRWEHDKRPDLFFAALRALDARNLPFRLALAGPRFKRWPACFGEARTRWPDRLVFFGPCEPRAAYRALLRRADLAVSTADHEFFGISMIEAAHAGAFVLVPDRLAYPEVFPSEYRYRDQNDLVDRMAACIDRWMAGTPLRADRRALTARFGQPALETFSSELSSLLPPSVAVSSVVSKNRM